MSCRCSVLNSIRIHSKLENKNIHTGNFMKSEILAIGVNYWNLYHNYEKYLQSPLKPRFLALNEQYLPNISDPVYSVHQSFMWFLRLNRRKSTFYPVTAPKDSKCWPIVTSSIQELAASNCDVTMTDCSRVVSMDAFLTQWCWGQAFFRFFFSFHDPRVSTRGIASMILFVFKPLRSSLICICHKTWCSLWLLMFKHRIRQCCSWTYARPKLNTGCAILNDIIQSKKVA